jgi:hypothetical protein
MTDRWVVGANLPWVGYGTDIGASAWHAGGGLSAQPAALQALDRTFATLAGDGVPIVRVFLICDARSGVRFDRDGVPIGLDDAVFPDIDALLACARQHDIRLMPVLLDFHLCMSRQIVDGVQVGGRSHLLTDASARRALVDVVLRPLVQRYGQDDAIASWDIMNEPEWCVGRGPVPRRCRVPVAALQAFLGQAVRCVHESARQPVTVGCAGIGRLDLVRQLELDFFQVHWYERFGWDALERPVADLGLGGRPVILGEFPGRSAFVADVLTAAKRAGYAAALFWSARAEDGQSAYPAEVSDWCRSTGIPDVAPD